MRLAALLSTLVLITACATARPNARGPASVSGEAAARDPVAEAAWYERTPPVAHYHLAILNDDVDRVREWIARGFSADTKVSPRHASAIQLAIATHRRDIVRLLVDNPRVEARPDPRVKVDLCPTQRDHLVVSVYDFIVFEEANERYQSACRAEEYYAARDRTEENLTVTDDIVEAFTGVARNERAPAAFRVETRAIRRALKEARGTTGRDTPNDRLLDFISNF